jgi:hypothetical protein
MFLIRFGVYFTLTFYRTIPCIAHVVSYSWLFAWRRICVSDFIGANKHPPFFAPFTFFLTRLVFADNVRRSRVISLLSDWNICSARQINGEERNWSCRSNYATTLTLYFLTNIICLLHRFSKNSFDSLFMPPKHLSTDTLNKKLSTIFTCQ